MRTARKANSGGINKKKKMQELRQHMFSAFNYFKAFVKSYRNTVLPRKKPFLITQNQCSVSSVHKEVDVIGCKVLCFCKTVGG